MNILYAVPIMEKIHQRKILPHPSFGREVFKTEECWGCEKTDLAGLEENKGIQAIILARKLW
jgi:hypothetical protein